MDRTSTVKQLNCTREEVLCCEPATETLPEALENETTHTVPKNRRDCACDRQQTEANYTQLDTEGAIDVAGFQTRNHKETGSHSESESSSLQAEHCIEATTSETKCSELTVESNSANTEPNTAEIQSTNDVDRRDSDHHGGESISARSCEHFGEVELLQQEENTKDGDECGVQNGNEDGENARNCGDHDAESELLNGENGDGHEENSETGTENSEASDEDEEAEASDVVAGEQHTLSGPHRRHRTARHQRRREAGALPQLQSRRISLPQSLLAQWREIGAQWGLQDDNDIAQVLLRHYEDTVAGRPPRPPPRPRCQGCGEVLVPLPCDACGPNQHSFRLSHDRDHGGSGNGRNGFCGRCRD